MSGARASLPSTTLARPAGRTRVPAQRIGIRSQAAQPASNTDVEGRPGGQASLQNVLLVGITGVTGRSALQGMLAGGMQASQLRVLTTHPQGTVARSLAEQGMQVVGGNLDDPSTLTQALDGADAVYCHALTKDAANPDPQELTRATTLAHAAKDAGVQCLVYNSAAGNGKDMIGNALQKQEAEALLSASVPTVGLRATLFMEELWKKYTRPKILEGKFPFAVPGDKPIALVAVRDMGRAAAAVLQRHEEYAGKHIDLAGDELSPNQMCEAFSAVQGMPVQHQKLPRWPMWFLNKELWRYSNFLAEEGYDVDIGALRREFPFLMTFSDFLRATRWADASLRYEDGVTYFE